MLCELLEDAKNGRFKQVVHLRLNRLSQKLNELLHIVELFDKSGRESKSPSEIMRTLSYLLTLMIMGWAVVFMGTAHGEGGDGGTCMTKRRTPVMDVLLGLVFFCCCSILGVEWGSPYAVNFARLST
ncbi:recombinase family protein [Paenibacillus whitsoniae]|uniref:Recombinase family protein n=1 Tax=Paenibacillus whitsoniae TaxID=2496558 RepID=A0A3S0APN9_9BACL|nr:recombinase family protein [Paenibacillus whitsoniae]RTE09481.1 recombinase family protein [Paenibacillus whitsoniae]